MKPISHTASLSLSHLFSNLQDKLLPTWRSNLVLRKFVYELEKLFTGTSISMFQAFPKMRSKRTSIHLQLFLLWWRNGDSKLSHLQFSNLSSNVQINSVKCQTCLISSSVLFFLSKKNVLSF